MSPLSLNSMRALMGRSLHGKDIAVLMGGVSAEREVSLVSGKAAAEALEARGARVRRVDMGADSRALVAALTPAPDCVFNALHGRFGEDGVVQGLLEVMGLPYTHSGVLASAVGMDKPLSKQLVAAQGVQVPRGRLATRTEVLSGAVMDPPYVVKPANEGSSVGVAIVREGANTPAMLAEQWEWGDKVLVERFVPGRELTVGVMGRAGEPAKAMGVTEIRFDADLFDYTAKYTKGHAEHVLPAPLPQAVNQAAMERAATAHEALGCNGVSRSDFRYNEAIGGTDGLFWLEINTQPGFTPISLVPEQAAHIGISFADLCVWLVETALMPEVGHGEGAMAQAG